MNCLDVRRICLTEPTNRSPRLLMHIYSCKCCQQYRRRILEAEEKLKTAMDVTVPEGLDRKIAFEGSFEKPSAHSWPRWQAMAATVMVSVALGVILHAVGSKPNVVPELARHMMEDPLHMLPTQTDAAQRLAMVMRDIGGQWQGEYPENLTHARLCPVRGRASAHLVVQGERGPVTVFLIPGTDARNENGLKQAQLVAVSDLHGGSIALFGYEGENLAVIEAQFQQHVSWKQSLAARQEAIQLARYR